MKVSIKDNFSILAANDLRHVAFGWPAGMALIHEHEELNPPWACNLETDRATPFFHFVCPFCKEEIALTKEEMDKYEQLVRMVE